MSNNSVVHSHGGLVQEATVHYTLVNGKRVPGEEPCFIRRVRLFLPLFLTVPLWKRHGYNLADIEATLNCFAAVYLWQFALLYGITVSNSAIKLAFATPESMIYGSKAIVIRKICRLLQSEFGGDETQSVLDRTREDHVPLLPLHALSLAEHAAMIAALPASPVNLLQPVFVGQVFPWRDINVAPLWFEQDAIYCVRVMSWSQFVASGRVAHETIVNRPVKIIVDGVEWAGLEEAMFFVGATA